MFTTIYCVLLLTSCLRYDNSITDVMSLQKILNFDSPFATAIEAGPSVFDMFNGTPISENGWTISGKLGTDTVTITAEYDY